MLDTMQSVAKLVLEHSECAPVFQRHGIDFCCRGDVSIAAAAKAKEVDVESLVGELSQAIAERRGEPHEDPRRLSTLRLVAHVVSRHHEYLRKTLPFVRNLAAKVSRVHGEHNPKLRELKAAVEDLAATLESHLDDEEQSLFPALLSTAPDRAGIAQQLASMQEDHLMVAAILARIRAASDGFVVPDWGCSSYRTLFAELAQLESDVFTHVHLENNVLMPRFKAG